jgi:hypothetical protein
MQQETLNRIRNRQIVMAPIEFRPDQSDCDAYPHLVAVTVSKRIELEGWGLAQPLHLFEFFQNLPYLVHLYATGDLQSDLQIMVESRNLIPIKNFSSQKEIEGR